jgi:hypothetical protein
VSGTAQAGVDYGALPPTVRFFPGQTTVSFPVEILDDGVFEGDETLIVELADPNLPDVTIGTHGVLTLTIIDNDPDPATVIFSDGFETGDTGGWSGQTP